MVRDGGRSFLCKCHPDFHISAEVAVGEGFDGDAYARRLKQCHVDAVVFFAKCHYGHSYYPTEVGNRHPNLRKDMLREVVDGCRKHGLGAIAYYSTFLDSAAVARHPDWARLDSTGAVARKDYAPVCVNTPYVEELLMPQCIEIVTQYDLDELLLDTMSWFHPCYCEHCRRLFGQEIPRSPADPQWLDYVHWYAEQFDAFFRGVPAAIHKANPHVQVYHNWLYSIRLPQVPAPEVDRLVGDSQVTSSVAAEHCRYWAGTGMPFDYMVGRFAHGLGDWTSAPADRLKAIAATSVANGGVFYIIDRQLPDGRLDEAAYRTLSDVFGFVHKHAAAVRDARHVPETAVLHAATTVNGADGRRFSLFEERMARADGYRGTAQLLIAYGHHFTGVNEHRLAKTLDDYRLVIVPEQHELPDGLIRKLKAYVHRGGKLLITQSDADDGVDEGLLGLAGVRIDDFTALKYGYVGTESPVLLRGRFARIEPTRAEDVHPYLTPWGGADPDASFGWGVAPPSGPCGFGAVTLRRLGKGEVIYVAAPAFRSYFEYPSHLVAGFLLGLIDRLLPDPIARIEAPPHVEMVLMRRHDDLLVHLVNHSAKDVMSKGGVPVAFHTPEMRGLRLEIRSGRRKLRVQALSSGRELPVTRAGGYAATSVRRLKALESVCVPGYFKERRR